MTQTIPANLITYESLDRLARALAVAATYSNNLFPDLTGDAAIIGDMLLAKINPARGLPYLKTVPPIAVQGTDLEGWFFWACGGSKSTGSFASLCGPGWKGYVTFMVFDTITAGTHQYLVQADYLRPRQAGTLPVVYDDRVKIVDLLNSYGLLPELVNP